MAKSIRSKWKRKCRAIKRERYAKKELVRLKKTLGIDEDDKKMSTDEIIEKTSDQVIFLDASQVKNVIKDTDDNDVADVSKSSDVEMSSDDEQVEVDGNNGKKRMFNSKTLKDLNGQYPVWLSRRKINKLSKGVKKNKRTKKRKFNKKK